MSLFTALGKGSDTSAYSLSILLVPLSKKIYKSIQNGLKLPRFRFNFLNDTVSKGPILKEIPEEDRPEEVIVKEEPPLTERDLEQFFAVILAQGQA